MNKPDRFIWAAELLNIKSSDQILEIGCGNGIVLDLLAQKLRRGTITGIDRSKIALRQALKNNASHINAGKVSLVNSDLKNFNSDYSFTMIFAFNVNLFWTTTAEDELTLIRSLLQRNGLLYLLYSPPSKNAVEKIIQTVSDNLKTSFFRIDDVVQQQIKNTSVCAIIART
jgi:trans-aconitate methyltransferase